MLLSCKVISLVAVFSLHLACLTSPVWANRVSQEYLRKLFDCPTCNDPCPPLPLDLTTCQPVMEPGICACCHQCARLEGDLCGLSTGRCGKGLTCTPSLNDPNPFQSLMDGTAICMPSGYL